MGKGCESDTESNPRAPESCSHQSCSQRGYVSPLTSASKFGLLQAPATQNPNMTQVNLPWFSVPSWTDLMQLRSPSPKQVQNKAHGESQCEMSKVTNCFNILRNIQKDRSGQDLGGCSARRKRGSLSDSSLHSDI